MATEPKDEGGMAVDEPVVIWDFEDEDGNHIQIVVESSGRPSTVGWTQTGRYIIVVWEHVLDDPRTIYSVTAYDVPPPGRNKP